MVIDLARLQELEALQRMARILWDQILGGNDTPRLRERVMRLEAAQSALLFAAPEMFAACGSCGRVPTPQAVAA
ncbi:hypothetical protein ACWEQU_17050 [Streptomyces nodosus]